MRRAQQSSQVVWYWAEEVRDLGVSTHVEVGFQIHGNMKYEGTFLKVQRNSSVIGQG